MTLIAEPLIAITDDAGTSRELAIAAVPYSSNLGDGVIHDIMIRILQQQASGTAVATLDISGRTRYAGMDPHERNSRKRGLRIINALPIMFRRYVILGYAALLYLRKTRHEHAVALQRTDHLIIGGGHLLSDMDLNFPVKLFSLFLSLRRYDIPFSIYAVGASSNWSPLGRYLFRHLLKSPLLRGIAARDAYSVDVIERELRAIGRRLPLMQVWDPAVATSLFHPHSQADTHLATGPRHIGINIADIDLLTAAGDRNPGISDGLHFFRDLAGQLLALDYKVTLFTNGAEEDELFLDRLMETQTPGQHFFRAARPLAPRDLIALLTSFDTVVSHRLHAHIISYSYGIPTIGLGWDRKVSSFFMMTHRLPYLVEADSSGAESLTARVLALLSTIGNANMAQSRRDAQQARRQLLDFLHDTALAEQFTQPTQKVEAN